MSVINNVLKDLEARDSAFTPIEITAVRAPAAGTRQIKTLLLAGLLFAAAAAAYYLWQVQAGSGQLLAVATPASAPSPAVAAPVQASPVTAATVAAEKADAGQTSAAAEVSAAAAEPILVASSNLELAVIETTPAQEPTPAVAERVAAGNEIIGLQLRESEQDMQMEFVLRHRVVAYLRERGENHFAYRLRDIESQIVAPTIRDNRWIRALSIDAADGGVDIGFETLPDILVETRQSLVDGEAVWVIGLRQAAPSEPAPAPPEAMATAAVQAEPGAPAPAPAAPDATPAEPAIEHAEQVRLEIRTTDPNAKNLNRLEYAVELINSRRHGDAEILLRELLGGAEDYPARQRLIALYQRDRRPDQVLRVARESMQKYPGDRLFQTEYARAMFQQNAYREVIALLSGLADPDAAQQALIAASHQRLDEHDAAVRHYRLSLAENARDARNWVGLGISQEHTSALEDALHSYQQAGKLGGLNQRLQAFVIQRSNTLRQVLN